MTINLSSFKTFNFCTPRIFYIVTLINNKRKGRDVIRRSKLIHKKLKQGELK